MDLKFLQNEPALFFGKTLVIADIHLGLEYDLYKSGIRVPSQTEKMKNKIDQLIKKTKAERIVFLGDIKHQVPGVSWQELKEVPDFFSHFSKKIETHIVLGNHDSEIPALVEGIKIHNTHGFRIDNAYIMHGHAWPNKEFLKCKYLITSHTHPLIEIKDKIGHKFVERVWVKADFDPGAIQEKYNSTFLGKNKTLSKRGQKPKLKTSKLPKIILMPAFNDLSGGAALNTETQRRQRKNEQTFLGPITSLIDKKKTEIYLLDGTYLGQLESLKQV